MPVRSRSTYRLQLHAGLTFEDAAAMVPHLVDLGVTHLYLSPIFEAVPGSPHGYDVVDPTRLRGELGGPAGFVHLLGAVREAGLGLVVDVVPNHMAVHPANPWWWEVLEDGPSSAHAAFFDIDWDAGGDRATVLVPVLADHLGRIIEARGLSLERDGAQFVVVYGDHRYPLSPRTLDGVLARAARAAPSAPLAALADRFADLPDARLTDAPARRQRRVRKHDLCRALATLLDEDDALAAAVDAELASVQNDADALAMLLGRQNYRLAWWRTANEELDYRRFFSIETLIGVRTEDPAVFEATHSLVLDLVHDGSVDVLRVDHLDGLREPATYLERLRDATGGAPVVVEKILDLGETLPSWPVEGTTGYDFLALVDQLFVDAASEADLTACYVDLTGDEGDFETVAIRAKHDVMQHDLAVELRRATALAAEVCERHRRHTDHTRRELGDALAELISSYDVYRTYWRPGEEPRSADRRVVDRAVARTLERRPDIDRELLELLGTVAAGGGSGPVEHELCLRLQQLTAPVMAKGVEDTAFYRYHRLLSLNEVGNDPGTFGVTTDAFHAASDRAARDHPASMLTLSTHDTKRSGDVRARLDALSEEPAAWRAAVERWMDRNEGHWAGGAPDRSVEYLLYQTLVGAWPIGAERVLAYLEKAIREAKLHTTWTEPDVDYEANVLGFARRVLADPAATASVEGLLRETDLVHRGRRNAVAQLGLLATAPGNPDLYQGSERWDLSLTDPDNRRPIDLDELRGLLGDVRGCAAVPGLDESDRSGKAWVLRRLLHLRTERPELFEGSGYEPLEVVGGGASVVAFRRRGLVVAAACRSTGPRSGATVRLGGGPWVDVLGGPGAEGTVPVDELLSALPVAVLVEERDR